MPHGAAPGLVRQGAFLTTTVAGGSATAPAGSFEDDTGVTAPVDGEPPVQVHEAVLEGLPAGTTGSASATASAGPTSTC